MKTKIVLIICTLIFTVFSAHAQTSDVSTQYSRMIPFEKLTSTVNDFCPEGSFTLDIWGKSHHVSGKGKNNENNWGLGGKYNCTKNWYIEYDELRNSVRGKATVAGGGWRGTAFSLGSFDFGGGVLVADICYENPKYNVTLCKWFGVPHVEVVYDKKFSTYIAPVPGTTGKQKAYIMWWGWTF